MRLPQIILYGQKAKQALQWADGRTTPQIFHESQNFRGTINPRRPPAMAGVTNVGLDQWNLTEAGFPAMRKTSLRALNGRKNRLPRDRPISTVLSPRGLPRQDSPKRDPRLSPVPHHLLSEYVLCKDLLQDHGMAPLEPLQCLALAEPCTVAC